MFTWRPGTDDVPHQHWVGKPPVSTRTRESAMSHRTSISIWFAATVFALTILVQLAGCTRGVSATPAVAAAAPAVSVANVLSRQISDFDELRGASRPERVEIRPRVSGYIAPVNFVQGREVTRGAVLFVIDPRPYEADLSSAGAARAGPLAADPGHFGTGSRHQAGGRDAISREELESRDAALAQAHANVAGAQGCRGHRRSQSWLHTRDGAHQRRHEPRGNHRRKSGEQRPDAAHHRGFRWIRST